MNWTQNAPQVKLELFHYRNVAMMCSPAASRLPEYPKVLDRMNAKNRKIGSLDLPWIRIIRFSLALVACFSLPFFCWGQALSPTMLAEDVPTHWLFETGQAASDNTKKLETGPQRWEFEKHGGVVYWVGDSGSDADKLKCDIYVPQSKEPVSFPAVIMIHGGAWRSGSKLHMIRHAWRLARQGFVVMAINYRHAPKHRYPAQLEDAQQAVAWLKENGASYSVDVQRVGVFGYSAGGHLGALLGTMAPALSALENGERKAPSGEVAAVAIGGAPCEFSWIDEDSRVLAYLFGDSRASNPEIYLEASPIHHVRRSEIAFRVFHGKSDWLVPISTAKAFCQKLEEAGVKVEFEALDTGHFGAFSDFACFDRTIAFFRRELGSPEPITSRPHSVHPTQE